MALASAGSAVAEIDALILEICRVRSEIIAVRRPLVGTNPTPGNAVAFESGLSNPSLNSLRSSAAFATHEIGKPDTDNVESGEFALVSALELESDCCASFRLPAAFDWRSAVNVVLASNARVGATAAGVADVGNVCASLLPVGSEAEVVAGAAIGEDGV